MKNQKSYNERSNDDLRKPNKNRFTRQDKRKSKQELNRMINSGFDNE